MHMYCLKMLHKQYIVEVHLINIFVGLFTRVYTATVSCLSVTELLELSGLI